MTGSSSTDRERRPLRIPPARQVAGIHSGGPVDACDRDRGLHRHFFSVVNRVLLQPLPYPDSGPQPVRIRGDGPAAVSRLLRVARKFLLLAQGVDELFPANLAAVNYGAVSLTGEDTPVRANAYKVTANYLSTLGVRVGMGRDFLPEEEAAGHENVAILGAGFWNRQFAGRMDIIGRVIRLDGIPTTVIGVTPKNFQGPDMILPAVYSASDLQNHGGHYLSAIGRLKDGTTIDQARE